MNIKAIKKILIVRKNNRCPYFYKMGEIINEINFPTAAGGFLNNIVIQYRTRKLVFRGMEICRAKDINMLANDYIKMPNFKDTSVRYTST